MFEVELKDMKATVFIGPELFNLLTASNVGVSEDLVSNRWKRYTFVEALLVINAVDKALIKCPIYAKKELKAFRGQMSNAFGPEFIDYLENLKH